MSEPRTPQSEAIIAGKLYKTNDLVKLKKCSKGHARRTIKAFNNGLIDEKKALEVVVPTNIKRSIKHNDREYDTKELMDITGLGRCAIYQRMDRYKNKEISFNEMISTNPTSQEYAKPTKHIPGDRSPGWWERKYLNPTHVGGNNAKGSSIVGLSVQGKDTVTYYTRPNI